MKDPFPPPTWLVDSTKHFAADLHLRTLPLHIHEVLFFSSFYYTIYAVLSPVLNRLLISKTYNGLSRRNQINWDVHVTSMVQCLLICATAIYFISADEDRWNWDYNGRLHGYDGASGLVQGMAAGYFIWDIWVSVTNFQMLGPSSLAHAIAALGVSSLGFYPFGNYYGLNFILYELSTPFLNIHWFLDKLGKTGSRFQLINGIALLIAFAGCRLVWGTWQSILIYSDVWNAWNADLLGSHIVRSTPLEDGMLEQLAFKRLGGTTTARGIPFWLVGLYLVANTLLSGLNFYWYNKMIAAVRKRFAPQKDKST